MTLKVITFKIDDDLVHLLDWYVMNHGVSRSEAIRLAIQKMINEELEKQKVSKARVEPVRL